MPNEMDERDSSSESSTGEIASETPKQQKPISHEAMPSKAAMPIGLLEHTGTRTFEPIAQEAMPIGLTVGDFSPPPATRPQHVEDEVTIEMKKMIQSCRDGGLQREFCIYKVPIVLRESKNKAYTPNLVSIGPYHHGHERLQARETHKQIYFKRFTQRANSSLDDLVRCVQDLEPKVRASYAETISYTPKDLVILTLMDAAFIIELIVQWCPELHDDHAFASQPWLKNAIILDFILLENQLPFFTIEELFNKALLHGSCGSPLSFHRLACKVFGHNGQKLEFNPESEIKHFTDLIRLSYLQGEMPKTWLSPKPLNHLRYPANALKEAGIKFKAIESHCLQDMKFLGHTLEIPQIDVDYDTEILFGNMIALEECHYPYDACITEYIAMMCWLMETKKDVDVLVHNKIVINNLGDPNSVVSLFNGLAENVLYTSFSEEYIDICQRMNCYYENRCHRTRAALWRTVAYIAGTFLLLLTIVQAISSVLQLVLNQ